MVYISQTKYFTMITPLIIDPSKDTPQVIFDKLTGEFLISGTSIPENTKKFFEPVFIWIQKYINDPNNETILNFKMDYFNTSSTKVLLDIMIEFKTLVKNKKMLIINWYFNADDDDMLEAGEGFSKMVRYPFNFIKRN